MSQTSSPESSYPAIKLNTAPIDLLTDLASKHLSGCLKLDYGSTSYFIHLEKGKVSYATNSVAPSERLERHLHRLSHAISTLNRDIRTEVKLNFEAAFKDLQEVPPEHKAIEWLIEKNHLNKVQASLLVNNIIREVFESILLLSSNYESNFIQQTPSLFTTGSIDLSVIIEASQRSLQAWHAFYPHITSSYQRPHFFNEQKASLEQQITAVLPKGFNFRQLAAILNQNEIDIANKFFPAIINKRIILYPPQEPFNQLPQWSKEISNLKKETPKQALFSSSPSEQVNDLNSGGFTTKFSSTKEWKIVCIDDSLVILNEISRFLDGDEFKVFSITEPLKALMKIIRVQPDLILIDVETPNIDGYKLCVLIRKYSAFKNTPVVMVTGNKGLIDRAKASMAGVTDYITKPCSQVVLLDIFFRYLS